MSAPRTPGTLEIHANGQPEFIRGYGREACIVHADQKFKSYTIGRYISQMEIVNPRRRKHER